MIETKSITVQSRYLHLPVRNHAPKRRMRFVIDGETVRAFDIELAEGQPDFWAFSDVGPYQGQALRVELDDVGPGSSTLEQICQGETIPVEADLYRERLRPQFHFSSRRGWNNDPNGLLCYGGEYHLFYQHNPYGVGHGNMHWGHAISPDLVHWQELGDALYPDHLGTCFSGSGIVDWRNTAGLQIGEQKTLVCVYTTAGGRSQESEGQPFTQSIAYSNDRGRTWHSYEGNPVLQHIAARNRDPKVIWYEPTQRWVMALYLQENDYALFASPNLRMWERLCDVSLPGATECPDFFPLPVDGNNEDTRWVFWGANGTYLLGAFDGAAFRPDGPAQRYDWGGSSYAAQTWSDIPSQDGRRIQIAWLRVQVPGMPFNQQMTFPCQLTLRNAPEGVRLFSEPVREIETLWDGNHHWPAQPLAPGDNPLSAISGELFDIRAEFEVTDAAEFGFAVRGLPVTYDVERQELTCLRRSAALKPEDGRIRLQILVDRASIEIFGNDGRVYLPIGVIFPEGNRSLALFSSGGPTQVNALDVHELHSAWRR